MHFLRFFLAFIRNYAYHFIFQKLIKGGVGIRAGGWKIFQKSIRGGAIIRYSRVIIYYFTPRLLE